MELLIRCILELRSEYSVLQKYVVVQEQAAVIAELNTKLKSVDKNFEDANNCEILYLDIDTCVITYIAVTVLVMRERLISSLLSEEYHRMATELKVE